MITLSGLIIYYFAGESGKKLITRRMFRRSEKQLKG
jgi:hypothetical protein